MVGIFYAIKACFRQNAYLCTLNVIRMNKRTPYLAWMALFILLIGCQSKTNTEKIDELKKQVVAQQKALNTLETKDFVQLERDFYTCDSLLQYMHPEEIDEVFAQLRLAGAYIEQFKEVRPVMAAEMDSCLIRLGQLKADAESHYFTDSLVAVYLNDETQIVERITNQVQYFADRFGNSQKDLDQIKRNR